jgi:hypothetical protein
MPDIEMRVKKIVQVEPPSQTIRSVSYITYYVM